MPYAKYKQRCIRCEKYVVTTSRNPYVLCYECEKKEMDTPINDPEMKKLFDIPEELYKANSFLRSIRINYARYEKLSERQIEAFKKAVVDVKQEVEEEKKRAAEEQAQSTEQVESKEEK